MGINGLQAFSLMVTSVFKLRGLPMSRRGEWRLTLIGALLIRVCYYIFCALVLYGSNDNHMYSVTQYAGIN